MPPTKLAHVVFQTNHRKAMQDWYCVVLGGRVIYENARLSFVTYDDEHHRVAFLAHGIQAEAVVPDSVGRHDFRTQRHRRRPQRRAAHADCSQAQKPAGVGQQLNAGGADLDCARGRGRQSRSRSLFQQPAW